MISFLMIKRGCQELNDIMPIMEEFLSTVTFKEFGDTVSNYLPRLFSAQGSTFTVLKDGRVDPPNSIRSGLCEPEDTVRLYMNHYYQLDPIVAQPFTAFPYRVYTTDDVVKDEHSFLNGEFYNDFLRRFSIRNLLIINLGSSEQPMASIAVARDNRRKQFGSADKSIAHLIQPCLAAAFERVLLLNHNVQHGFVIDALLDSIRTKGIVELDETLRPVRMNHISHTILSALRERDESVNDLPDVLLAALKDRMGVMLSGRATTFAVKSPKTGQKVTVLATQTAVAEKAHVLLTLTFEHPSLLVSQQLRQYGLTDREVEIAACLCEGLLNDEIADKLCISKHTVLNHTRHIFEKSRVRSRAALVQRVLELTFDSLDTTSADQI